MLKLKTKTLQEMTQKAMKGASHNKILPLTSMLAIELRSNVLTLTTTDFSNYLEIRQDKVEGDDFYVVVQADMFSKLIGKLTTEDVTLTLGTNVLTVKANGTYKLELPVDEDGSLVKFPNYRKQLEVPATSIKLATLKSILTTNRASVAQELTTPALTGYYVDGNGVLTSDSFVACHNKVTALKDTFMLPFQVVELFNVLGAEDVNITVGSTDVIVSTPDVVIYGKLLMETDNFPVNEINEYLQTSFSSSCKLPKDALLSILDRLSLFVGQFDKNEVYLTFTQDGIMVESKQGTGNELIKYAESKQFQPFTCCIDIEILKSQIQAQQTDVLELYYGDDSAIKLASGAIVQIVSLSEDDRVGV